MLGILLNTRHRCTRGSGRLFIVDEAAAHADMLVKLTAARARKQSYKRAMVQVVALRVVPPCSRIRHCFSSCVCEQGLFTALDACEERQFVFMADRVLTRLQKRTHVFENKKANEKRNAGARTRMHQLDAGVSLSRAVKLGPGERRRRASPPLFYAWSGTYESSYWHHR